MKKYPTTILVLLFLSASLIASDYSKSYTVVVSKTTYKDPNWKQVVTALQKKNNAEVVTYEEKPEESLPKLKQIFPKYTCFVVKPEDAGSELVIRLHRLMRKLDSDPYADSLHSIITGYTAKDALRVAKATTPTVASTALISAGMGPDRFKESGYLSTGKKGEYGHKTSDGKIEKKTTAETDTTSIFIDFFEKLQPDILVTSAHASQRNLEMPFSTGNLVCKDGRFFGYLTDGARLIGTDGQALNKKIEGKLIPVKQPTKPMIYFAPGNCLIGDIPDRNCMALAFLGWGKGTQMIGYTTTTWFGMVGWGAVRYWENMAGYAPLNESLFFSKQNLLYQLKTEFPETANYKPAANQEMKIGSIAKELIKLRTKYSSRDELMKNIGMIWDRDVVAFYGDPAHQVRHDIKYTLPAKRKVLLKKDKDGIYKFKVTTLTDINGNKSQKIPVAEFFPERLKNIEVISGQEFNPIITDNFIIVTKPGAFKTGEGFEITFKAEAIN